jgi:hypothetical protein
MIAVLRRPVAFAPWLSNAALLAGLLGLAGCGGLDTHRTASGEYTITADSDGGLYSEFEAESLKVCPQGFYRMNAVASPAGESRYASWRVRCTEMPIRNAE